jgi:hypothetical protein
MHIKKPYKPSCIIQHICKCMYIFYSPYEMNSLWMMPSIRYNFQSLRKNHILKCCYCFLWSSQKRYGATNKKTIIHVSHFSLNWFFHEKRNLYFLFCCQSIWVVLCLYKTIKITETRRRHKDDVHHHHRSYTTSLIHILFRLLSE